MSYKDSDAKFYVKDHNGIPVECELLYRLIRNDGKYILTYTDGTRDEDGNVALFSCLSLDPPGTLFPRLRSIEKNEDWRTVEEIHNLIKTEFVEGVNAGEDEWTIARKIEELVNKRYVSAPMVNGQTPAKDSSTENERFEFNDENSSYYLFFGFWYFKRKKYDKALESLQTAKEYKPNDVSTNSLIAYILRKKLVKDFRKIASCEIEDILSEGIASQDPFSILNLGLLYLSNSTAGSDVWEEVLNMTKEFDKYDKRDMIAFWDNNEGRMSSETMLVKLLLSDKGNRRTKIYLHFVKKSYPNLPENLFI